MNMKNATLILLVLATITVAGGARYSARVAVDPASYTMPVDPNDPIFAVVTQHEDPNVYAAWKVQFGDTERTKTVYAVSFNREILLSLVQRVRVLEARVAALEPVRDVDPNAAPMATEEQK